MKAYWITGPESQVDNYGSHYVGTFAEARAVVKKVDKFHRLDVLVEEVDVLVDKAAILRLLNSEGKYQTITGRRWVATARMGLREIDEEEYRKSYAPK